MTRGTSKMTRGTSKMKDKAYPFQIHSEDITTAIWDCLYGTNLCQGISAVFRYFYERYWKKHTFQMIFIATLWMYDVHLTVFVDVSIGFLNKFVWFPTGVLLAVNICYAYVNQSTTYTQVLPNKWNLACVIGGIGMLHILVMSPIECEERCDKTNFYFVLGLVSYYVFLNAIAKILPHQTVFLCANAALGTIYAYLTAWKIFDGMASKPLTDMEKGLFIILGLLYKLVWLEELCGMHDVAREKLREKFSKGIAKPQMTAQPSPRNKTLDILQDIDVNAFLTARLNEARKICMHGHTDGHSFDQ